MRATLVTTETFSGTQRKLAWFALHGKGLYFEAGGLLWGSHTSYHVDGNVFRTSPASGGRPRFQGKQIALAQFTGWYQLGTVMIQKELLSKNPPLKSRDTRPGNIVAQVPALSLPSATLNIVLEFMHSGQQRLLERADIQPPPEAIEYRLAFGSLIVVATVLGHEQHLLVRPTDKGFTVFHFNDRFTANAAGVTYNFEAYR